MRVNVIGHGVISGVGVLPVRDIELADDGIKRLLNYKGVRVFNASTGELITSAYFRRNTKPVAKVVKPSKPPAKKPEPVIEPKKEEYLEPVVEVTPEVPVTAEEPVEIETVETPVEVVAEEREAPAIEEPIEEVTEIAEGDTSEAEPVTEDTTNQQPRNKKRRRH